MSKGKLAAVGAGLLGAYLLGGADTDKITDRVKGVFGNGRSAVYVETNRELSHGRRHVERGGGVEHRDDYKSFPEVAEARSALNFIDWVEGAAQKYSRRSLEHDDPLDGGDLLEGFIAYKAHGRLRFDDADLPVIVDDVRSLYGLFSGNPPISVLVPEAKKMGSKTLEKYGPAGLWNFCLAMAYITEVVCNAAKDPDSLEKEKERARTRLLELNEGLAAKR